MSIMETVEQKAKRYVRLFSFKCLRNNTDGHTYIKTTYANNTFANSPAQYAVSVSYTHLDVYKRQTGHSAGAASPS